MQIELKGKTNSEWIFLNTIILVVGGGRTGKPEREITLDREETGWSIDDEGNINITFETPYIWDGEGMEYDGWTIVNAIDEARYFYAEIEDDAPADYKLKVTELSFMDSCGESHFLKARPSRANVKDLRKFLAA